MTLAVISRPIADEQGNLLEGAVVTIREGHDSGGDIAEIFSDPAGLNPVGNPVTVADGNLLVYLAPGKYRLEGTSSGGSGTSVVDALSYNLKIDNFGGLTGGANQLPYFTGANSLGQTALTAQARSLLDDTSFAAMRNTLGLGTASVADVTTSPTNTTGGRLLRVGAGHQQLDATLYRRGNLLGTVNQSGGVPTGAVIQRGSNANGEFVRLADGTQICTRTITFDLEGATTQTFAMPATFWVVEGTAFGGGAGELRPSGGSGVADRHRAFISASISVASISLASNSEWNFRVTEDLFPVSEMANFTATLHARGRWF